jgi:NAD(P)H-hydrate epimerase
MGAAVRATATITFVGLKPGFWLGEGRDCTGELFCDDLDVPPEAFAGAQRALRLIGPALAAAALPRRSRLEHKGNAGRVVIAGGGPGMPGAVRLAAEAALRVGAGLVTVLTHPAHAASLVIARPEIICHAIDDAAEARPHLDAADVVALGPGLGQSDWARALHAMVAARPGLRVLDADALNLLAQAPHRADDWILTPHPGEAARLLGRAAAEVQRDRRGAALALAVRYGGIVVLKGAGSLVAREAQPPWVCAAGNPGMATAGMGDVLTGVIAGVLAQCRDPELAAAVGVELHARAGDRAARAGERGLLASDLLAELRAGANP